MKSVFRFLALLLIPLGHWCAISYLKGNFSLPDSVTGLHFAAVAFAYLQLLLGLLFVKSVFGASRVYKALSFFMVLLSLVFFVTVYSGNAVSLKEWGEYISLDVLGLFFEDAADYMSHYGGVFSNLLRALLVLIPAFIFAKPLADIFDILTDFLVKTLGRFSSSSLMHLVVVALLMCATLFGFYKSELRAKMKFKGEPLYNFFVPISSNFDKVSLNPTELAAINEYKSLEFEGVENAPNLILIVVDALRADRLPMYGYPNNNAPFLQGLFDAGEMNKVDLALSNCSTSFCGILSILSGKSIQELRTANFKLHDVLKKRAYQTNFLLSGSHNEWYQMKRAYTYHYPIDVYFDGESNDSLDVSDDLAVLERLRALEIDQRKPQFMYLHLMSAHRSGIRQEKYRKYLPDFPLNGFNPDSLRFNNAYDNGVIQSDDYIKTIFDELAKKGMLENSIVVVTADHGEALGEHGRFGHAVDINQGNLHIPFLVYNSTNRTSDLPEYVSQGEMMAVMLDELDIETPAFTNPEETDITYHRQGNKLAVVKKIGSTLYKLLTVLDSSNPKLYNLDQDPNELNDLSRVHPDILKDLKIDLEQLIPSSNNN